jgi:hypothetical protein
VRSVRIREVSMLKPVSLGRMLRAERTFSLSCDFSSGTN